MGRSPVSTLAVLFVGAFVGVFFGTAGCGDGSETLVQHPASSLSPLKTNGRPADAVIGQLSFSGEDAGTTTANGVNGPSAITAATQESGTVEIWVADEENNRVLGWLADPEFSTAISNGDNADIVLGQVDFLRSDGAGDPSAQFTPIDVAVVGDMDTTRQLYVTTADGEVVVFDDPHFDDDVPEYTLQNLPFVPLKVSALSGDALAVHDDTTIAFYSRGSPARIIPPSNPNTDGTFSACTTSRIAGIAATDSFMFVACASGTASCSFTGACVTTATASVDSPDVAGACSPATCGAIFAFAFDATNESDLSPNNDTGLPVFNTYAPVFSGFVEIQDIEGQQNRLYVADSRNRVLRLSNADAAASQIRAPTLNNPPGVPLPTQNIWGSPTSADVGFDRAYGQDSLTRYVQNRGRDTQGRLNASSLVRAIDIALDNNGVYTVDVSDDAANPERSRQRVLRYAEDENGAMLVLGQPDFEFDDPNRVEGNGFEVSISLALHHATNTLYVADRAAHRILQFDTGALPAIGAEAVKAIGQDSGVDNLFEYLPNRGGSATFVSLAFPDAVAVDPSTGDLFVRDVGNTRVVQFTAPRDTNQPMGDALADGQITGADGAIAFFDGRIFVVSGAEVRRYAGNDEQRRYGDDSVPPGEPSEAPGPTAFGGPVGGIAFDRTVSGGSMYVSDTEKNRILRFDRPNDDTDQLAAITADFVIGQSTFFEGDAATTRDGLSAPRGLAVDGQGRLWVADSGNNRVLLFTNPRELNANGRVDASLVLGQPDFESQGRKLNSLGMVDEGTLSSPHDVETNEDGSVVYVVDTQDNRVLRFTDAVQLAFTSGPGDYDVVQGETLSVGMGTTFEDVTFSEGARKSENASLDGSALVFDSAGLAAGTQVRVDIVASVEGPPAQSAIGAFTFLVVRASAQATDSTATPPPESGPRDRAETGCACGSVDTPWLAALVVAGVLRRRRKRYIDSLQRVSRER